MITIHDVEQGSDEWHQLRCGIMTASDMCKIMTASYKPADNESSRKVMRRMVAQQITQYVEPSYMNDHMMRGHIDEIKARDLYIEHYNDCWTTGIITNDEWGYTLGFSPDGLVGDDGCIEVKSKIMDLHINVIVSDEVPKEHILQMQTGLLVSGRKWCDFISYCQGLPMFVKRVEADYDLHDKIINACNLFHADLKELKATYEKRVADGKFINTEPPSADDLEIVI